MTDKPENPIDPIPSELAQEDESFIDLVEEFVEGLGTEWKRSMRLLPREILDNYVPLHTS